MPLSWSYRANLSTERGKKGYFSELFGSFSSQVPSSSWDPTVVKTWFSKASRMMGGASSSGPPVFNDGVSFHRESFGLPSPATNSAPLQHPTAHYPTSLQLQLGLQNHATAPTIVAPSIGFAPPLELIIMAYQGADPTPFLPHRYMRWVVPSQQTMVRAFAHRLMEEQHNDVAIVTFDDLPYGQII